MANVKKIRLPSNTTYNIGDYRIPDLTTSDAGKILKVNSTGSAFEIAQEAVQSVNGQTGTVSLTIPTATSQLTNDSGYITINDVPPGTVYAAGTGLSLTNSTFNHSNSVTAKTTQAVYPIAYDAQGHITGSGNAVTIPTTASQIAVADTEATSYGNVQVAIETIEGDVLSLASSIPERTSDLTNDSGFITSAQAPVQSVNGQTGTVTLTAANVGAIATPSSATNGQVLTYNGTTWVASTPAAGGTQKVTKTITGDGNTINFTFSTSDVVALAPGIVQVYDSTGKMIVTDITFTTTSLIVGFDEAPTTGTTYTVVIIG